MLNLEQIVTSGHIDEAEIIARARGLLRQTSTAKTRAQIEVETLAEVGGYKEPVIAPYEPPQLGFFERSKREKRRLHHEEYDKVVQQTKDQAIADYGTKFARARETRGTPREDLYREARDILGAITGDPFALRGSRFKSLDRDEAEFLNHYVNSQEQREQRNHEAVFESLERMIETAGSSLAPALTTNSPANEFGGYRNVLTLEQARVLMEAGIYPRAIEVANKVDDTAAKGEASRVKVEIYLADKDYVNAAAQVINAYTSNPGIERMDSRVVDVIKGLISIGSIDAAVHTLDRMTTLSPNFNDTRKNSLLLEQARVLVEAKVPDYDRAVKIAKKVDNKASNGQATRLMGEAYLKQGQFNDAANAFVEAYGVNPNIGIDDMVIETVKGQIRLGFVDEAVSTLDGLIGTIPTPMSPWNGARKYSLLLEQARAFMEAATPNYGRAVQIADKVDDRAVNGQASYLRGQIRLTQHDYKGAVTELRKAFELTPRIEGTRREDTRKKIADTFYALGNLTTNPEMDYRVDAHFANVDAEAARHFREAENKHEYAFVLESKPMYEAVLSRLQAKEATGATLNANETAIKALTLFSLARVQRLEGNVQGAVRLLDESLAVMPTKKVYNNFSDLYARQMR